jgi:hypothetical protein
MRGFGGFDAVGGLNWTRIRPFSWASGALLPEDCQTVAVQVQVHQSEVRTRAVMVLREAFVSHFVEAEDALQDPERMFYLGPHPRLTPVLLFL